MSVVRVHGLTGRWTGIVRLKSYYGPKVNLLFAILE